MGYLCTGNATLGALNDRVRLAITDQQGWSISLPVGLVGTVRVQTSWDDGATWTDDPNGVLYLGAASTVLNASGPVPAGATAMQVIVTAYTSGSCYATLRATASSGPPRATASGTLGATGDTVTIPVDPSRWATVRVLAPGTVGAVFYYFSADGGTNWLPSPYATRTDLVSANPSSISPVAASAYPSQDIAIPGNATHLRVSMGSVGVAGSVTLTPGRPLVPGVPVVAVLYDASEGSIGAGLASAVYDVAGWNSLYFQMYSPTTQAAYVREVDDTGAVINSGPFLSAAPAGAIGALLSRSSGASLVGVSVANGTYATIGLSARRLSWSIPAGGTVTQGRIRVEASR
jgi:hypothetical protein